MLGFFRRLVKSRAGLIVTFVVLGFIAFAFASGDVSGLRSQGLAALGGGDSAIKVGRVTVSPAELKQRMQQVMEGYRQQQPTLDMAQFIAGGGFEATVQRLTDALALEQFGQQQGMVVSKRAEDGQIASIPGLQGPSGKFDQSLFRDLLAQRKLTEVAVRDDLRRDILGTQLTERLLRPSQAPEQLALPYAGLSLEKRAGVIGFVPSKAMAVGTAPTDAELRTFYARNIARYTVPERRTVRFASVTPEQVRARATPSEAEIAQAYQTGRAKYAATEKRTITQVVVLDQGTAAQIAAKVKSGTALAAAATAAGLEASTQTGVQKAGYATLASSAVADAVFAAAKGSVVGPIKGALGFTVARVDAVEQVAGRSLAQAHDEIAAALAKTKTVDALNATRDAIDDALGRNSTFDEIVADQKLTAQTTPGLLANGLDPDAPAKPDPALAPILTAAFQMAQGDEPQLVPTSADGAFAVVALGRIAPAAPRSLAAIHDQVARDIGADRARLAARKVAGQVLARVNGGATIAAALTATGLTLPPPHDLAASREDVERAQGPGKAPLALMFAMAQGTAKLLEAPGGAGWVIIKLDRIVPGDASRDPQRIAGIRAAFGQVIGREYAEQFARAARKAVGVTIDTATVARVRAELLGQGGSDRN